jgi:methyl-accepting chemotaxis protein
MKHWTIAKRIALGSALLLLIATVVGLLGYARLRQVGQLSHTITGDTLPSIALLGQARSLVKENNINVHKHVLASSTNQTVGIEAKMKIVSEDTGKVYADFEPLLDDEKERKLYEEVRAAREPYTAARKEVLVLSNANKKTEAAELLSGKVTELYAKYIGAIEALMAHNADKASAVSQDVKQTVASALISIIVGLTGALVVGIVIATLNIRTINRSLNSLAGTLNDGSEQVSSAAGQVAAASQTLAEGASEQAASLEETGASLEEMSSMTKRNAENAQKANELAAQARTAADAGSKDMAAMSQAMQEIKTSSDDIAKIIKTIDEIAFQTNILALNAAVEAARAGEAGMGFAVVADEVRNLAQRSAQSAKETAAKIETAISKTAQGVAINQRVAASLDEIVDKTRQVDTLAAEVANASREQSQGISQVNIAVTQMDKVTQSNAASAEESASAAEELNAQAGTLKEAVLALSQLVGGKARQSGATSTPRPAANGSPVHGTALPAQRSVTKATAKADATPHPTSADRNAAALPMSGDFKDF